jgi:poly(hydroxyalkanoate) granule-associated protein
MVKKLKAMAEKANGDGEFAAAVKDSAQQIWLAGLGAFAKAQEEGQKVFKALVKEGSSIHKRTMRVTEDKVQGVTEAVGKVAGNFSKQANGTWDKLENVFEQRVERALGRLGVPTHKEVAELNERIEKLTEAVHKLSSARAAGTTAAAKPAARRKTASKAAKKAAA